MLPFKAGVIERLAEVYTFAKREHELMGPDGYKIAITGLLGFTPTNWEIDEVFKNQDGLSLQQLKEIVEYKLKYIYIEQYVCDIFANFDPAYNGFVTLGDVRDAWTRAKCDISWGKIEEAFREISHDGILDYTDFQDIINGNNSEKFTNKYFLNF